MMIGAVALASTVPLTAQNAELQQKLAAVKQSVAENKQVLQQYQWTETTELTLKGRCETSIARHVPVRSWRASSEDARRPSAATSERWQDEAESHCK
jgi:hypothetical protein